MDMETGDLYIEFTLDDDYDDTEAMLTIEEARALGIDVERPALDDDWIIWN